MKNKDVKKIQKIVLTAAAIVWVCVIFSFSLSNGTSSSNLSHRIMYWIATTFHIHLPVFFLRKAAHFLEYAILGLLIASVVPLYKKNGPYYLVSWVVGIPVSIIDECIQHFVPGRSGNFIDVSIDMTGVFAGVAVFLFFRLRRRKRKTCDKT